MKELTGEWNDTLLSSVMTVGFAYMQVMDVHVYGKDLVRVIFRRAFAHGRQAPPQASWCGAISYNLQSHLVFLQGKLTVPAILHRLLIP